MTVMTRSAPKLGFDPAALPGDLLIGGAWRPGATGKRIDVVDPSTGSVIASVADASAADALDAVAAAHAALPAWAATPPRKRSEILRRCFELMLERREMLAELISLENGKALPDAAGEVAYSAEFFRWFSEEAVRLNGELGVAPSGANRILVEHQPIGVAVLVTPWNFPAAMATRKIAPALAAGCTVVLKPATETPFTAYVLAGLFAEAGVPRRRAQRPHHLALRRHRQRHAARPARAQALLHRLDRGRPHAAQGGRRPGPQLLDGARRQRPLRRLRRRRPRGRARRRDDRQDAQRRRGLHRRQPLHRAGRHPRPPSPRASPRACPR